MFELEKSSNYFVYFFYCASVNFYTVSINIRELFEQDVGSLGLFDIDEVLKRFQEFSYIGHLLLLLY